MRAAPFGAGGAAIHRHTWKWVVSGLLAAAAVLWFLRGQMAERAFDWELAGATFARVRWRWVLLSVIPIFGTYYGRAMRWAVFLKPLRPRPSIRNLLTATIIGYTAVTLFGRAGEFVRPYLIARKEQVPVPSQFAAWILERLFDLLMALLLFGFALTRVRASDALVGPKLEWVLEFGGQIVAYSGVAVLLALLSMRHFAERLRRRLTALDFRPQRRFSRVEKLISACIQGVESTRSDAALLLVLAYSVAEWILISACYWCLAQAFTGIITLSFVDVLILTGFVSFGAVVQIPGVGGGIQVAAVLVLTELFRVRLELATAFAILIWILTFVAIVPFGLLLALKEGLNWRSLKQIGQEVS